MSAFMLRIFRTMGGVKIPWLSAALILTSSPFVFVFFCFTWSQFSPTWPIGMQISVFHLAR